MHIERVTLFLFDDDADRLAKVPGASIISRPDVEGRDGTHLWVVEWPGTSDQTGRFGTARIGGFDVTWDRLTREAAWVKELQ